MKFKCIKRCYFKSKVFEVGEIYNGEKANKHFTEVVDIKKGNKFVNAEKKEVKKEVKKVNSK